MDEEILIALRAPRYYDPEDLTIDTAPKCYRCGEQGHVARNCTGAATSKPCYLCAETGHEANSCPNTGMSLDKISVRPAYTSHISASPEFDLFSCQSVAPACRAAAGMLRPKALECARLAQFWPAVCFKCGQRGHQMRDCPSAEGPTPCMRCGDPTCGAIGAGDAFRDPSVGCQRVPSEEDLSRAICVVCGAKGHLCCVSWMPDFATPSCFNCGEEGHTGMECDEPRPRGADVVLAGPGRSYREAHAFRLRLAQEWGNDDELDDQGYDR